MVITTSAMHWCSDAIKGGLLQVIVSCSAAQKFQKTMTSLLNDVLPASLIHYYGLQTLENELVEAMKLAKGLNFRSACLLQPWKSFVDLARERLGRVRSLDETWKQRLKHAITRRYSYSVPELLDLIHRLVNVERSAPVASSGAALAAEVSITVLQNVKNWTKPRDIAPRSAPSVSVCLFFYRLSTTTHKSAAENDKLSVRERAFLRTFLSHDYNVAKYDRVYPSQTLLLTGDPRAAFLTLFDYRRGCANIEDSDWPNRSRAPCVLQGEQSCM
ncbi:hypothetical protein DFH09DRAFT_1474644 [Mycena vulgaris]|nr:hypothetical protein DFH09DRAFT_1474644 [Mycena vulgaris]